MDALSKNSGGCYYLKQLVKCHLKNSTSSSRSLQHFARKDTRIPHPYNNKRYPRSFPAATLLPVPKREQGKPHPSLFPYYKNSLFAINVVLSGHLCSFQHAS